MTIIFKEDQWEELAQVLREEATESGALLNLLNEQQERILGRETEAIVSLTNDINKQIEKNAEIKQKRIKCVTELGDQVHLVGKVSARSLVVHFPMKVQGLLTALVDEVSNIFIRCQNKATQNQMLLVRATETIEQILKIAQPESVTRTYDKKGVLALSSIPTKTSVKTSV